MNGKTVALYLVPVIVVVGLIVFAAKTPVQEPTAPAAGSSSVSEPASSSSATRELAMACVTHGGISFHIHPMLAIVIDGKRQEVPANVGIDASCMHVLHTHDATGMVHVEYPDEQPFTLGDFFAVWGKPFDREHLLDNSVVDSSHRVRMTVDGRDSDEYEKLVLKDGQVIVLYYETIGN